MIVRFLQWPLAADENLRIKLLWRESVNEQPRLGVANLSSIQKQIFTESNLYIWGRWRQHWCFQLSKYMLTDLVRYLPLCIMHRHTILSLYMAILKMTQSALYTSVGAAWAWFGTFYSPTKQFTQIHIRSSKWWKCYCHVSWSYIYQCICFNT